MGSLIVPSSGSVYVDAPIMIYSVEKHPAYATLIQPLWLALSKGNIEVITSELTIMESIVAPLRHGDTATLSAFDFAFTRPGMRLLTVTESVLRDAAGLRATTPALRTPDAIHAATAISSACTMFLTNDSGFRRVPTLPVTVLDDLLP